MLKRPHYAALVLVLLLVAVLLSLPQETGAKLKIALGGLFLPLFGLAGAVSQTADKAGEALLPRNELVRELDRLRHENEQLRLSLQQAEVAGEEATRLRRQLSLPRRSNWVIKLARVIGREPSNWWRSLEINLGSREGMRPDMAVVAVEGLVGRISSVRFDRSQVLLVGDPNCRVSAIVQDTRESGIVTPSSSSLLDHTLVDLTLLPRGNVFKPGQRALTSGLGGVFPKGIPIGTLVDTRTQSFDLYTEARLKLAVDSSRLEEVWVIIEWKD
jgi:rod shape-determining protein MreC